MKQKTLIFHPFLLNFPSNQTDDKTQKQLYQNSTSTNEYDKNPITQIKSQPNTSEINTNIYIYVLFS